MTRVAVYARYSSELQQDRSIDDQFALCRDYAARRNWAVTSTYADRAVSGASVHGRHEFQRMMEDAKDGSFDLVLAEDIDRLARNQADGPRLFEKPGQPREGQVTPRYWLRDVAFCLAPRSRHP